MFRKSYKRGDFSMYRSWHGPIVGLNVSHVWSSYATCLFLEFECLTPGGTYMSLRGEMRQFEPSGTWSMTSMENWPAWWIRQNGRPIGSWVESRPLRARALRLLVGRRLNALEIDQRSKSTRLTFSLGLVLETKTDIQRLRTTPHWLLRGPAQGADHWPHIALRSWADEGRESDFVTN
jgi:hypothetical protein